MISNPSRPDHHPIALLDAWGDANGRIINYTIYTKQPTAIVEVRKLAVGGDAMRGEAATVEEAATAAAISALKAWAGVTIPKQEAPVLTIVPQAETPRLVAAAGAGPAALVAR